MKNKKYLDPASSSIIIEAPSEKVWETISTPGVLELCHPFCKSNPVENWNGKNSVDLILYYSGLRYQRIFTDWIEGVGYDLLIGRRNGKKSKVVWRINKINEAASELKISIYPYEFSNYPKVIRPVINFFYIGPMLRKYLASVLKGFNYYIIAGKPVEKNQFGNHNWFSTK